jgi:hypothetical protein
MPYATAGATATNQAAAALNAPITKDTKIKKLLFACASIILLTAQANAQSSSPASSYFGGGYGGGNASWSIAQKKSFYNERGSFAGSSVQRGNATSFYNSRGSFDGSAIRHGKWTSFYDGRGHYTGSSINTSPRR